MINSKSMNRLEATARPNKNTVALVLQAIEDQIRVANGEPKIIGMEIDPATGKTSYVFLRLWIHHETGIVEPMVDGFPLFPEDMNRKVLISNDFHRLVDSYTWYLRELMYAVRSGEFDEVLNVLTERLASRVA